MGTFLNPPKTKSLRSKLRKDMPMPERILWKYLKNDQMGFKFRRQYGIGPYIVDFFCDKLKLIVEVDGEGHCDPKTYQNDLVRQKYLESLGFTLRRYSGSALVGHTQDVLDDLYNFCDQLSKNLNN